MPESTNEHPGGTTVYAMTADQVCCDLDGEAVILNTRSGMYYGLNETGASVWRALEEPVDAPTLVRRIAREYEVDEERCRPDVTRLLKALQDHDLVVAKVR